MIENRVYNNGRRSERIRRTQSDTEDHSLVIYHCTHIGFCKRKKKERGRKVVNWVVETWAKSKVGECGREVVHRLHEIS